MVVTRRGFTFVELLIAATMMSVMFVGLAGHLRGGLMVWERVTTSTQELQRQRMAFTRLDQDLANALAYGAPTDAYGEDDEEGKLPKPRFEKEGLLAWYTIQPMGRGLPARVRYVRYWCGTENGVAGLWRTSQSIGEARAKTPPPTPQRVWDQCDAVSSQYAYASGKAGSGALTWKSSWEDPMTPPRLLEMTIDLGHGRKLRRLVTAPQGIVGGTKKEEKEEKKEELEGNEATNEATGVLPENNPPSDLEPPPTDIPEEPE